MNPNTTEHLEWLGKQIVDSAFKVHYDLGPGLLESVYRKCLSFELHNRNISHECEVPVKINYKGIDLENSLRIDILVENMVIVELKAQDVPHPIWKAQILSYLKLTDNRLGFIINFHVPKIKDGIDRYVN